MQDKPLKDMVITPDLIEKITNIGIAIGKLTEAEKVLLRTMANTSRQELNDFLDKAVEVEKLLSGPLGRILYDKK